MMAMRQYLAAVLVVWLAACIAAYFYSQQQNIPAWIAYAVLPAFLIEAAFYIAPGFESVRAQFRRIQPKAARSAVLTVSAVIPYLTLSAATGTYRLSAFLLVLGAGAVIAFWYAFGIQGIAWDLLFLAVAGFIYMSPLSRDAFVRPVPHADVDILGKLMLVHVGLMSILCIRGIEGTRFGFIPLGRDWLVGVQQFLLFLPIAAITSYAIQFARFRPHPDPLLIAGTFFGVLWVVALPEEFVFRGFLQQMLARSTTSNVLAIAVAATLFGLVHLPHGHFPNWKLALLAALAGVFYGIAFLRAKSIRASMVTHALVVTTWRVLFPG